MCLSVSGERSTRILYRRKSKKTVEMPVLYYCILDYITDCESNIGVDVELLLYTG